MIDQRNFTYLAYGLVTAWGLLALYVIFLATRESKLRQDINKLREKLGRD